MARILVADDQDYIRSFLRMMLEKDGHEVDEAGDGNSALSLCRENHYDLVLLDIFMPDKDGIETIVLLVNEFPGIRIVAMSGGGPVHYLEALERARSLGAVAGIAKPFGTKDIREIIARVLGAS